MREAVARDTDTRGRDRPRMRIGFQVWGQYVSWAELMEVGALIDELGFDGLWANDHLLPVVGGGDDLVEVGRGPVWDAWMTLMGWAERTRTVSLGSMVSSVSYRNPALLVKMATALDHASGGRAILGIGAGWHATEHRAFGFAFPDLKERLDRLDEASIICRQLLDGGPAHLDGRWCDADGATNEPPPLQARIPLLIGGSGERRTLPIVARDADAWNGEGDPDTFARKNMLLDQLSRVAGRDPTSIRRTVGLPPPLIREERADAIAASAAILGRHGLALEAGTAASARSPLVGPASQVASHLQRYRDAGAEEAVFDWPTPSDEITLRALAGEVRETLDASGALR